MFTFNIHGQADDLSLLEPLVRHLGHVEIAIDYLNDQQPPAAREHHPVVEAIEEADRELRRIQAAQVKSGKTTYATKLAANAERKRKERLAMAKLSPEVIAAVACPTCYSGVGRPCCGPSGAEFGFTGHTHFARRQAFKDIAS